MRSKIWACSVCFIILMVFAAPGWTQTKYISLLTCSTAGTWYPIGGGLAKIWTDTQALSELSSLTDKFICQPGQSPYLPVWA